LQPTPHNPFTPPPSRKSCHPLAGAEDPIINWHQAGGPDHTANGLALCTLHHKLFDVGAFTLSHDLLVAVSSMAHGDEGFQRWLLAFNGAAISPPSMTDSYPKGDFLAWHVQEVFKGEVRYALDLG